VTDQLDVQKIVGYHSDVFFSNEACKNSTVSPMCRITDIEQVITLHLLGLYEGKEAEAELRVGSEESFKISLIV
jgi:hypothetical protein